MKCMTNSFLYKALKAVKTETLLVGIERDICRSLPDTVIGRRVSIRRALGGNFNLVLRFEVSGSVSGSSSMYGLDVYEKFQDSDK